MPDLPSPHRREPASAFAYAIAVIGPIAVAGVLVGVRGQLDNANAALILVVVVVLAAVEGGRGAGAVAAIVAALSFDFFLTRPYLSLTIASSDDVETAALLLVIGLVVGQVVVRARRSRRVAALGRDEIERLRRVAGLAATGAPADAMVAAVSQELTGLLELRGCRFEASPPLVALTVLTRSGTLDPPHHEYVGGEFALPPDGVELPVTGRGRTLGRFVLEPTPHHGVSLEERVVAVALADQLGAVLTSPEPANGS